MSCTIVAIAETKGPSPSVKLGEQRKSWIRAILVLYPDIYLDELLGFLNFSDPNLNCSICSLSRTLKTMRYSLKITKQVASRSDELEIKHFIRKINSFHIPSDQFVFLDEPCNAEPMEGELGADLLIDELRLVPLVRLGYASHFVELSV